MNELRLINGRTSTLFFIFTSVILTSLLESSGFQLVTSQMKYEEAKNYCRGMNTDLASVYSLAEVKAMLLSVLPTAKNVWIGLELGELWIWHWTGSNQGTTFLNWRTGQPKDSKQETCAAMDQNGMWFENDCTTQKSFVCQVSGNPSSHILVEDKKLWRDARSYCWNLSSDLVTIHSAEENKSIQNMSTSEGLWIGLFKDPWTYLDGSNSSFRFWDASEPNYGNNQGCVTANLANDGKWSNQNCNTALSFICGTASNQATTSSQTTYQSITPDHALTNKTTSINNSSKEGATTFPSNLVNTEQPTTNVTTTKPSAITELLATVVTSDLESTSTQRPSITPTPLQQNDINPARPTPPTTTEVVSHTTITRLTSTNAKVPTMTSTAMSQNVSKLTPTTATGPTTSNTTKVVLHPITTRLNNTEIPTMTQTTPPQNLTTSAPLTVIGPTALNTTEAVSHPISNDLSNTNTEMPIMTPTQLPQSKTTSAPTPTGPIKSNTTEVDLHLTAAEFNTTSTEFTSMTSTTSPQNDTTPAPLTVTGPAAFNTTEVASHPTIPQLNSTEMTPTQPQNTTVSITTNSIFTSVSQVGTSVQTLTGSPAPLSTVSSLRSEDKLILIQKNMTWIAAMSYCREHYVDLVQITSKDIQDKVAEKVKSSTSPHTWLGLRYTCNFSFWFWTSSAAGCYQNWRPGEGPEKANECGESGAIEATGRQQWVGLPETRELNFICQTCGG